MKFTFFRRHLRKAAVIETLLGTVGIPVNLAVAALMARVVQSALSGDTSAVLADGVWLAALLIGYRSVETLLRIRQERRRSKALHNCKLELYDRFLSRPLPWLCACGSGEIKERMNDDFTNATDKLLSLYPNVIVGALTGVSYLLFVSRFSLAVSAVMVLLSILQGVPKLVLKARFERNYSETRDAEARLTDYLLEARHGFITLKLYDLKELYLKKLKKLHDGYVKIGKRSIYTGTSETVLTGFASVVVKYGMYAAVGIMVLKRIVSLGAGVEAVALAGSFFAATKTIFDSIPRFAEVGRAEARLGECLSDEDVGHSEIEGASVSLSDVSLQRGDKEILHRASVVFPTGGLCLIKGVNGAGKSTLLKLTVGLLRADEGDVRVGGAVPETISADSFPHGLFYLPQEDAALAVCPREFYGMVCGADVSAVMQLARAFGLGDAQLDGTNINTLSGGERKKVFLALALAAEPTILLMDEPTNSLDEASKTLLLSELKKRRGLSLIVTHDSIFDDVCDRVYFAERGRSLNMRKISSLRGRIMSDCAAAMLLPAAVYAAGDLLGGILTVYTAGILGSFADAVLRMNVDGGMRSFLQMLVCLAVNIVVVPLIGLFGEVLMFTRSLKHERYCVGSFLDKSYRSVSEMGAGEVQYSIDDDPIDMRCNSVDLAENVVIIPVIFAYLVYRSVGISPLFTVITAAVSALKLTVPVVTRKAMAKFDRADKEYQAELREYETEMTERPHIVRLYGLKKAIIERFDRLYLGYFRRAVRRSSRYRTIAGSILSAADPLCTLTVLFVGVLLASRGHITIGSVAAMVGYLGVYSMLFSKVGSFIRTLPLLRVNIDRVEKLYSDGERRGGEQVADDALIRVDGLSFRYVDKPVLDNVTFSVEKGDKLAVTGANGSGKSTLIMLLCGLFEGYDGSIEVGGHELRETDLKAWRRCFAFVQQDPYLFDGSVLENVRIGDLSADDARVKAVMEQLGILYLADRDATRSEKVLSGGERQRISLARALLKGTDLLIFDEPGNNLDPTALAWMADYIKNCDKTVIVVTHDELLQQAANKTLRLAKS